MSQKIEILFSCSRNGMPAVVVEGKLLGYAKKLEFSNSDGGHYLARMPPGLNLVKVIVEKGERITGIPHGHDVPSGLRYVIELEDRPGDPDR